MKFPLARAPVVNFEDITNRTRRFTDEMLDAHWMMRLRKIEEDYEEEHLVDDDTGDRLIDSEYDALVEKSDHENRTEDVWAELSDVEYQGYNILKPDSNASCELISCVSSSSTRDVACLDLRTLNMSAGAFSSTISVAPLHDSKN